MKNNQYSDRKGGSYQQLQSADDLMSSPLSQFSYTYTCDNSKKITCQAKQIKQKDFCGHAEFIQRRMDLICIWVLTPLIIKIHAASKMQLSTGTYRSLLLCAFFFQFLTNCVYRSFDKEVFVDHKMTWYEAKDHCAGDGGKLVEIDSEEENAALVDEIKRRGYT